MNRTRAFQGGFSLVETLIAFMLLAVMGGAVVYILAQVTSLTKSADLKGQGTFFANQGIEAVRDYYQKNQWLALAGTDNSTDIFFTCYKTTDFTGISFTAPAVASGLPVCGAFDITKSETIIGSAATFYRQIGVRTTTASGKVEVSVVVYWTEKSRTVYSKVDSVFYNY